MSQETMTAAREANVPRAALSPSDTSSEASGDYLHLHWDQQQQFLQLTDSIEGCSDTNGTPRQLAHVGDGRGSEHDTPDESLQREAAALLASIQSIKNLPESELGMPSAEAATLTNSASGWGGDGDENEQERSRVGCVSCWSEEALTNNNGAQPPLMRSWQQQGTTEEDDDGESQVRSRAMSHSHLGGACQTGSGGTGVTTPCDTATPLLVHCSTHTRELTNAFIDSLPQQTPQSQALQHLHPQQQQPQQQQQPMLLDGGAGYNPRGIAVGTPPGYMYYIAPSQTRGSRDVSGITSPVSNALDPHHLVLFTTAPGTDGASYPVLTPGMFSILQAQQQAQQQQQQQQQQQSLGHNPPLPYPNSPGNAFYVDPRASPGVTSRLSSPNIQPRELPSPSCLSPTAMMPSRFPHTAQEPRPLSPPVAGTSDLMATLGSTVSSTATSVPMALSTKMSTFLRSSASHHESESTYLDGSSASVNTQVEVRSGLRGGLGDGMDSYHNLAVPCSAALSSFLSNTPMNTSLTTTKPRSGSTIYPTSHSQRTFTVTSRHVSPVAEGVTAMPMPLLDLHTSSPGLDSSGFGVTSLASSALLSSTNMHLSVSPMNTLNNNNQNHHNYNNHSQGTAAVSPMQDFDDMHGVSPSGGAAGSSKDRAKRNVYVTGLPPSWNTTRLRQVCDTVGTVLCAKVARDRVTNRSLCYGFVLYESETAAKACINRFNGMRVALDDLAAGDDVLTTPLSGGGGVSIPPALVVAAARGGTNNVLDSKAAATTAAATTVLSCRFAHERAAPTFGQTPPAPNAGAAMTTSDATSMTPNVNNNAAAAATAWQQSLSSPTHDGDALRSLAGTCSMPLDTTFGSVIFSEVDNTSFGRGTYSTLASATGATGGLSNSTNNSPGNVTAEALARASWAGMRSPNVGPTTGDLRSLGDTVSSLNVTWPTVPAPQLTTLAAANGAMLPSMVPVKTMGPFTQGGTPVGAGASVGGAPLPQWLPASPPPNASVVSGLHGSQLGQSRPSPQSSSSQYQAALDASNQATSHGHHHHNAKNDGRRNVYITNLPRTWNTTMLRKLCAAFGHILSASVAHHRQSNEPLGYGFVLFEAPESAARCIRNLDQKVLVIHTDDSQPFVVSTTTAAPGPTIQQRVLTCRYAKDTAAPSWLGSPNGDVITSL